MHKFFAKTQFLGKNIEFLPDCHSTNAYLQQRIANGQTRAGDVVIADFQSGGRGQRGNAWHSEPGQNLLFSFMLKPDFLSIRHQFMLTVMSALAISRVCSQHGVASNIKWPNDVWVDGKKIAGILTESAISGRQMEYTVVGIGMNINQTVFPVSTATSLRLETGQLHTREEVFDHLLGRLEDEYDALRSDGPEEVRARYHNQLLWRGEQHLFRADEETFNGTITGIDEHGRLLVDKNGDIRSFDIKEISFLR